MRSEPHMRKMLLVGPKAGQTIAEFSRQFQSEFVTLLRTRHQTNRVRANAVYNEYIQDKHHVHMNATRWVTLSGFIMTIGKAGLVKVDEDEKGLWIIWVDNSPKTLAKQVSGRLGFDLGLRNGADKWRCRRRCRNGIERRWMGKNENERYWKRRLPGPRLKSGTRTRQVSDCKRR